MLVLVVSSVFFVMLNGYIHLDSGLTVKAAALFTGRLKRYPPNS